FSLMGPHLALLVLDRSEERSLIGRELFYVRGGILSRPSGGKARLEFRTLPHSNDVLAAIHEFHPRLPWWLYRSVHAPAHLWVMLKFGKHLATLPAGIETRATAAPQPNMTKVQRTASGPDVPMQAAKAEPELAQTTQAQPAPAPPSQS
ncbi:MAG: hypothetical protein MK135_14260, partial [Polyangiaceae bacterium]|nr:hypothetical protein [Polyangiaceae bacterium]